MRGRFLLVAAVMLAAILPLAASPETVTVIGLGHAEVGYSSICIEAMIPDDTDIVSLASAFIDAGIDGTDAVFRIPDPAPVLLSDGLYDPNEGLLCVSIETDGIEEAEKAVSILIPYAVSMDIREGDNALSSISSAAFLDAAADAERKAEAFASSRGLAVRELISIEELSSAEDKEGPSVSSSVKAVFSLLPSGPVVSEVIGDIPVSWSSDSSFGPAEVGGSLIAGMTVTGSSFREVEMMVLDSVEEENMANPSEEDIDVLDEEPESPVDEEGDSDSEETSKTEIVSETTEEAEEISETDPE